MTRAPTSYTDARNETDELSAAISAATNRVERGVQMMGEGITMLSVLSSAAPNGYLNLIQYITAQAAANPNDAAWQRLNDEKAKIVDDYQARLASFQAKKAAADNA